MEVQQNQMKNEIFSFFIKDIRAETFILGHHRVHLHATAMTLKKLSISLCPIVHELLGIQPKH